MMLLAQLSYSALEHETKKCTLHTCTHIHSHRSRSREKDKGRDRDRNKDRDREDKSVKPRRRK